MADKLVNMKLDPKEREKRYAEPSVAGDAPIYPYGLTLQLDEEALAKLGVGDDEFPISGDVRVSARATVTAMSSHESENGKNRSVSLQITDLAIDAGKKQKKTSDVLFSKE